jgi:superfamily II DNA or RNA helicase
MDLQRCPRVLTHLGYAIRKDSLEPQESVKLRKDLTVTPKVPGRFAKEGEAFRLYKESASRYYVPRMWGIEHFGEPLQNILVDGEPLRKDLQFIGKPYEYQEKIVQQFLTAGANGLICVPCGRGKTFMAIQCAALIGRRFMIIVDKEFLLQQWSGELKALMPGIRIGVIQEDKKQIGTETIYVKERTIPELKKMAKDANLKVTGTKEELVKRLEEAGVQVREKPVTIEYDCCIAMIQTLVQREFAETDFRGFGFAIFDECHHLGASNFSQALTKVQTKKMLGLSATPTRDDGLTKVFEWFLGKPVYWEKTREADPDVIVRKITFNTDDAVYCNLPTDARGETVLARLLTQIVNCEERNQRIDEIMRDLVKDAKRRILVLSERKSHLERIEQGLRKNVKGVTIGYYIGGMKEEVREEGARTAQVLLGTYAMASEAMNIKTLNTMVMASPRKKIEQSTGRILRVRKDEREVVPIIIDIVDSHDVYHNQWMKRRQYYRKCAYKIEGEAKGKDKDKEKTEEDEIIEIVPASGVCLIQEH